MLTRTVWSTQESRARRTRSGFTSLRWSTRWISRTRRSDTTIARRNRSTRWDYLRTTSSKMGSHANCQLSSRATQTTNRAMERRAMRLRTFTQRTTGRMTLPAARTSSPCQGVRKSAAVDLAETQMSMPRQLLVMALAARLPITGCQSHLLAS